jgi:hypothetical protein
MSHLLLQVSAECMDLISQLLTKNPQKRLGYLRGAEEIKAHPFFKGINWALIRQERPPFVPKKGGVQPPAPAGAGAAGGTGGAA